MKVLFTPSARLHFLEAIQSIQLHSTSAARNFRNKAEAALKQLSQFPHSGTTITEFPELPYREIYVKPYRFFYRVQNQNVWIVAVWYGTRSPDTPEGP